MARRKKEAVIIESPVTDTALIKPEPEKDEAAYLAEISGLSTMLQNHMRELERLRGYLHLLALRGDAVGKAANLMLERTDMTAETLQSRGIL